MQESVTFFSSDLGQAVISLENAARVAYADPQVEDIAQTVLEQTGRDDPFYQLIDAYIDVNDLVHQNLQSNLSSDYNFFRGMANGQALDTDNLSLLGDLWANQDEARQETSDWLFGFLLMAYRPLGIEGMGANLNFSKTPAGQALNAAMFVGFDRMFDEISYELGLNVGRALSASDL